MSWLCRVKRRGDTTDLLEDGPASGTKTITNTNTIDTPVCRRCRAIWRGTTREDTTRHGKTRHKQRTYRSCVVVIMPRLLIQTRTRIHILILLIQILLILI